MNYSSNAPEIVVQFAELQRYIKMQEVENQKLDSTIKEREATIHVLTERKNKHQAINAKLTHYMNEAKNRSESVKKETDLLYNEILSVKKELDDQAAQFELSLEQKKGLSDELFEIEKELTECLDENDQLQKKVEDQKAEISSANKKIAQLMSKKNMLTNTEFEKKKLLFELERKLHDERVSRENLCNEIQKEEKRKEDADMKRLTAFQQINNIQNVINNKLEEKSFQEKEIQDLKETVAELEEEKKIKNDLLLKCEAIKIELATCISEKENLEEIYAKHCAGVDLKKVEIQLNTELEKTVSELEAMKDTLATKKNILTEIEEKIKNQEEKCEVLKEKESKLRAENELVQKKICDVQEEIKLQNNEEVHLSTNRTMLQDDLNRLEHEIGCQNKILTQKQAKNGEMAELHKKKLAEKDENLTNLKKELCEAEKIFLDKERENEDLKNELSNLEKEVF